MNQTITADNPKLIEMAAGREVHRNEVAHCQSTDKASGRGVKLERSGIPHEKKPLSRVMRFCVCVCADRKPPQQGEPRSSVECRCAHPREKCRSEGRRSSELIGSRSVDKVAKLIVKPAERSARRTCKWMCRMVCVSVRVEGANSQPPRSAPGRTTQQTIWKQMDRLDRTPGSAEQRSVHTGMNTAMQVITELTKHQPIRHRNRKHWAKDCRNRFEAYFKKIVDPDKHERSGATAYLAIDPPMNESKDPTNTQRRGRRFSLILIYVQLNGFRGVGIYDTGANRSVIDLKTAKMLGLQLIEVLEPIAGVCGSTICRYLASGELTIGKITKTVTFLVLDASFGDQLLIGLDIIHLFHLAQSQELEILQDGQLKIELLQPVLSESDRANLAANLEKVRQSIGISAKLDEPLPPVYNMSNSIRPISSDFTPFPANSGKSFFGLDLFAFNLNNQLDSLSLSEPKFSVPKFELNYRKAINPDLPAECIDRIEKILIENDCFARDEFDVGLIRDDLYSIPLKPDSNPVYRRPYHTSEQDLEALNKTIDVLIERGVLKESFSNFAAGVVLVAKKDTQTKRLTIDYRGLNQITLDLDYPFPTIEEMIDSIGTKKYLSTMDMNVAFWHFPVAEEDMHKTAFRTPNRHLEFTRMPMGHKNTPAVMQRGLQRILIKHGLSQFCRNFFDDINTHSDSFDDHCHHLAKVLGCFKKEGIKLKLSKCKFGYTSVIYLGHKISQNKVEPLISHVEAIINFPRPQNVHDLQRLLGKINYHRRFIPNATELLNPFFLLLSKDAKFVWAEACEQTFEKCKEILITEKT